MNCKLKQILDRSSVNTAMMCMAKKIDEIGPPLAIVAILKGGAYVAYEVLKLLYSVHLENVNDHYYKGALGWNVDDADFYKERPDIVIGHIGLESYGDEMKSRGEVKLMTPLDLSRECIRGRKVIIIDDCIETGATLNEAERILMSYNPLEVHTAVLVDKATLRMSNNMKQPDIIGWTYLGNGFLVGCGMGAGERYRELSEICEVMDE